MTRNKVMTWVLVAGALPLSACGGSSTDGGGDGDLGTGNGLDLAKIAIANTERAMLGAHGAGSFIADSPTFAESLTSLGGGTSTCTTTCNTDGVCTDTCIEEPVTVATLQADREDLREGILDFVQSLRDEIFSAELLERTTASSATYRFGVEQLCGEIVDTPPSAGTPAPAPGAPAPAPAPEPMYDPECVDYANSLQPRLHLTAAGTDKVNMAVQLTSTRRTVASVEFYPEHVSASVDLGEVRATLESIGEDLGTLREMDGTIAAEIRRNGELDYSLLGSVTDDIVVAIEDEETLEQMRIGLGASVPSTELRLNGNARNITGTLDYGALTLTAPLNSFKDSFDEVEYDPITGEELPRPTYTGTVEALIAGYEGSITFDGSTDHLTVSGIGMGNEASTLKFDGQTISQFDLNPMNGRHFDLDYTKSPAGALFTFSPTLDVNLLINFAPLLPQIPDISPSLLNERIRVWFEGANPSIETGENQLKVVSGTLHVESQSTPEANLTVPAGMCLVNSGATDPANEAIGSMVTGACQ